MNYKYYENCELEYYVEVYDGNNKVLFNTDYEKECDAIEQYFRGIWSVERVLKTEVSPEKYLYVIKSINCYDFENIISTIEFRYDEAIFYDLQPGYRYENSDYYMVMRKNRNAITCLNKSTNKILYLRNGNVLENIHLSQLIKEPLNLEKISKGHVLLHSSAVVYCDKTIVFPAKKQAGKSTLVMGILNDKGTYIGNDSNLIKCVEEKIMVEKNPHCIRLGKETIDNNCILKEFFSNNENVHFAKMLDKDIILNSKIQFVPSALNKIYGRDCIADGVKRVSHIIFPTLDIDGNNYIKKISKEEACVKLRACIEQKDHRICWLPIYLEDELVFREKESCIEIMDKMDVEVYEVRYNGDINKVCELLKEELLGA